MGVIVPETARIGVLRANALGDFIQALPALDALRCAYPYAEITLIGRDWHEELLGARPSPIDAVYPLSHGVLGDESVPLDVEGRERAIVELRERRFDICLQMHGGGRNTNPFVASLGARLTAGFATRDAPALDRTIFYDVFQPDVLRNIELVALVGGVVVAVEPHIALTDDDLAASAAAVPEVDDGRPMAVIHPGASDTRRRWPAERFAVVADALAEAGARVIVTGTRAERTAVDALLTATHCPLEEACGRLSLGALVGLLARAAVVVSNDTGPRHLAAAVGTPTVSIYWIGNLVTAGPLTRAQHRVVPSWNLECPECGRNCIKDECDHRSSFVIDVEPSAVTDHALTLLAQTRQRLGDDLVQAEP